MVGLLVASCHASRTRQRAGISRQPLSHGVFFLLCKLLFEHLFGRRLLRQFPLGVELRIGLSPVVAFSFASVDGSSRELTFPASRAGAALASFSSSIARLAGAAVGAADGEAGAGGAVDDLVVSLVSCKASSIVPFGPEFNHHNVTPRTSRIENARPARSQNWESSGSHPVAGVVFSLRNFATSACSSRRFAGCKAK